MVRLADLPDFEREHMLDKLKGLEEFSARPWVKPPPLASCRIAIVSTAGLHARGDRPFGPSATATGTEMSASKAPAVIVMLAAMTAPTERSMPPVMITKVMPLAITALIDTCRPMLLRFSQVRKRSLASAMAAANPTNPAIGTIAG